MGSVTSMAAGAATGVAVNHERRVLGLELAAGNQEGSTSSAFIRLLVELGIAGVRLVTSDDHSRLVNAVHEDCRRSQNRDSGRVHECLPRRAAAPPARGIVAIVVRRFARPADSGAAALLTHADA